MLEDERVAFLAVAGQPVGDEARAVEADVFERFVQREQLARVGVDGHHRVFVVVPYRRQ